MLYCWAQPFAMVQPMHSCMPGVQAMQVLKPCTHLHQHQYRAAALCVYVCAATILSCLTSRPGMPGKWQPGS